MAAENAHNPKWVFAWPVGPTVSLDALPHVDNMYDKVIKSRDNKCRMYEKALNAALENLMQWETAARADGFEVKVMTDIHNGEPHPVLHPDGTVEFVQAYGVMVRDMETR